MPANRTGAICERLAKAVEGPAFVLEGGVDGWEAAGLPVEQDRKAPLEMMRQVQIAAGLLVLAGVGLGFGFHPGFFAISGFVGAGLIFAEVIDGPFLLGAAVVAPAIFLALAASRRAGGRTADPA